jgi:hypothetical protein
MALKSEPHGKDIPNMVPGEFGIVDFLKRNASALGSRQRLVRHLQLIVAVGLERSTLYTSSPLDKASRHPHTRAWPRTLVRLQNKLNREG